MIAGTTYLEKGSPVLALIAWKGPGPRNVLIRRLDGREVVRPFRGLRRVPDSRQPGKAESRQQTGGVSC